MRNLRKQSAPAVAAPENEDDDLDIDDMPFLSKGPAGGRARKERAPMVQVNARSRDQQLEPLPVSRADDRKPI